MKNFFLCITLSLVIIPSFAQKLDVFGGLSISYQKEIEAGARNASFTMSALGHHVAVRKPIHLKNDFFAVTPMLSHLRKGGTGGGGLFNIPEYRNYINYLQLSVPIGPFVRGLTYKKEVTIEKSDYVSAGLGPYIAIATGGINKLENTSTGEMGKRKLSFGNNPTNDFKRIDYGLTLVSAVRLKKIILWAQYDLGMANIGTNPNEKVRNKAITLGAGFTIF